MLGLEVFSKTHSSPSNLKGKKLLTAEMNRTRSFKFKKLNQIQSARLHFSSFDEDENKNYHNEELQYNLKPFFFTRTRVLRGYSEKKRQASSNSMFIVRPQKQDDLMKKQQAEKQRTKIFYYSKNLNENMNVYLNNLLNKSEQKRQQKLQAIQKNIPEQISIKNPSFNTQNQFWRKMRKSLNNKKQRSARYQ